ncbi:hypothetical protein [Haladaptatus sp. R4]|uniref:hypothetical protein n=1 Tax=Haladaptatus sp. R4 TaxID=1679489 RepID=UPI0012372ADA|nr:hypothetical protein [Haladaptatus sp. R4]
MVDDDGSELAVGSLVCVVGGAVVDAAVVESCVVVASLVVCVVSPVSDAHPETIKQTTNRIVTDVFFMDFYVLEQTIFLRIA